MKHGPKVALFLLAAAGISLCGSRFVKAMLVPESNIGQATGEAEWRPLASRWPEGTRTTIRFAFTSGGQAFKLPDAQEDSGSISVAARMKGVASSTVFAPEGNTIRVGWLFALDQWDFQVGGQAIQDLRTIQPSCLVFAVYSLNGALVDLLTPPNLAPAARHIVLDFLRINQFSQGPEATARDWVAQEQDIGGVYEGHYSVVPSEDTRRVVKKAKSRSQNDAVEDFSYEAHGWKGAWPEDLRIIEKVRSNNPRAQPSAVSERTLSWHVDSASVLSTQELVSLHNQQTQMSKAAPSVHTGEAAELMARSRSTLGSDTWETLRAKLSRSGSATNGERVRLAREFVALLRLNPAVAREYTVILATASSNSYELHTFAGALVETGTEEAQEALRNAIKLRMGDPDVAFTLMVDMAQLQRPNHDTVAFWKKLVVDGEVRDDARRISGLALGAAARRLKGSVDAEELTASFRAELENTADEARALHLLHILGNGGQPSDLPVLVKLTDAASITIRREALMSLRFEEAISAQEVLVNHLRNDQDPDARRSAAEALAYQKLTGAALTELMESVDRDNDSAVRLESLSSLWQNREQDSKIIEFVRQTVKNHTSMKTKEHATKLLASASMTPAPGNSAKSRAQRE